MKKVTSDKLPNALGPYSPAKMDSKGVLYISGQLGMDKKGNLAKGVADQTRLALTNMGYVLEAAEYTFDNIVKATVLLKDMEDFSEMNKVYAEFFGTSMPARAAYQVARLPKDALVEIEAIASV
jgi:2-iminobutanoate/2-iminopropanoate deaminase